MCPHCRLVVCECEHVGMRSIQELEAEIRVLMMNRAAIQPRGFDTIQQRANLVTRIDNRIDEIHLRVSVAELLDAL